MRIRILSDLHLEFLGFTPPAVEADVVILAGDIDNDAKGVPWATKHFTGPILYVPGNHEYYGGSLGKTWEHIVKAADGTNVRALDGGVADIDIGADRVRFVCATLWTDYRLTGNQPLAMWDARQQLNDYRTIRSATFGRLKPSDLLELHHKARRAIEKGIEEADGRKVVVVTHHGASELSIPPRYRPEPGHLNASFSSRLEHLMGPPVVLWIHGHTHDSLDYEIAGTRVVCNPRGYGPNELNPEFNPRMVIEV